MIVIHIIYYIYIIIHIIHLCAKKIHTLLLKFKGFVKKKQCKMLTQCSLPMDMWFSKQRKSFFWEKTLLVDIQIFMALFVVLYNGLFLLERQGDWKTLECFICINSYGWLLFYMIKIHYPLNSWISYSLCSTENLCRTDTLD